MRHAVCAVALAFICSPARAGDDQVARIAGQALTQGGAMTFLERLADDVGGRVTGSPELHRAQDLVTASLKDAGLANVHAEDWTLLSRWRRGHARAHTVSAAPIALTVGGFGWIPSTPGPVEGPLVDLGMPDGKTLSVPAEKLKGAVVLADFKKMGDEPGFLIRARVSRQLAQAGAVALMVPSTKPDRMLDIGCFGNFPKAALPMLSVAADDGGMLRRLLARGGVRLALDVQNDLDSTPAQERNLIAEIPGREHPEEVILLGAHLDSWDPGQGAQDDGSGVAALVDAARILNALGERPARTIRFAFFAGEEQAILGSQAYVKAHAAELDRIKAVVVMDEGADEIKGFKAQGRKEVADSARRLFAPIAGLGGDDFSEEASFDQDHAFFMAAGVPALTLWTAEERYDVLHHAVTDTLDHVDAKHMARCTAVVATAAWLLANADAGALPKRLPADEAKALLARTGLAGAYEMASGGK
jgi:carboxypeptidase Q